MIYNIIYILYMIQQLLERINYVKFFAQSNQESFWKIVAGAANFQKTENWQMYLKRVILTKSHIDNMGSSQTTNKQKREK